MALYHDLPVYKDTYQLTCKIFEHTHHFPREYKYTLGQDMKRDALHLMRNIYRVNKAKHKQTLQEEFLDDFELLKLQIRLCSDMKLLSHAKQAELATLTASIGKQMTGWRNASL